MTDPVRSTREDLRSRHGTPEDFEAAIWRAHADLFLTTGEAAEAIRDYRRLWADASDAIEDAREDDPCPA